MALFVTTETQWVKELNSKNDAVATLADLLFGTPTATTAEEKTATGKDTKCTVTGQGAKYYGTTTIYFNRLDLSTPFANQMVLVEFHQPVTTLYDQLALLNESLSTVFTEHDVEDWVFDPVKTEGVFTLTAKSGSAGWKGSVDLAYVVTNPDIVAIPDIKLDGVMTPNNSTDLEQAGLRYCWWDFKDNRDWFLSLPTGPLSDENIASLKTILNSVDSTQWSVTGPAENCLAGAEVLYVGNDSTWAISNMFPNVLVIQLSSQSLVLTGRLYLHFSDPEV